MQTSTKEDVHAAIADIIRVNSEPYNALAKRLNISTSSVRRIAAKFGISRQKSIEQTVLDTLGPNWAQALRDSDPQDERGEE
jgi:uncharacterized protein YdbL (DUF1318 family)